MHVCPYVHLGASVCPKDHLSSSCESRCYTVRVDIQTEDAAILHTANIKSRKAHKWLVPLDGSAISCHNVMSFWPS
jgi:hypothetical protein